MTEPKKQPEGKPLFKVFEDLERMSDKGRPFGFPEDYLHRFVQAFARGGFRIILEPMVEKPSDQEG